MAGPYRLNANIAWVVLALAVACNLVPRETAQETLGHHVHVDLTGTWSSTPWNPSRDARGVPLPQPEETTLSSRFQLPEDLIGHGSDWSWRASPGQRR